MSTVRPACRRCLRVEKRQKTPTVSWRVGGFFVNCMGQKKAKILIMTTLLLVLLGTAAGLAMTWLQLSGRGFALGWLANRPGAAPKKSETTKGGAYRRRAQSARVNIFQAVEVSTGLDACEAASALDGQRFLASEAPQLPLQGCDRNKCSCRFRKLRDRRHAEDRRFSVGAFGDIRMGSSKERREVRNRRSE